MYFSLNLFIFIHFNFIFLSHCCPLLMQHFNSWPEDGATIINITTLTDSLVDFCFCTASVFVIY